MLPNRHVKFPVADYDLAATLDSGQAFRWRLLEGAWEGVVGDRWVRLRQGPDSIEAETAEPVATWAWLTEYLQLDVHLSEVLETFPKDTPMQAAVRECRGLRLLRQEPWECLASFICSSTKQIVQIKQIVELLCQRYGATLHVPDGHAPVHAFPTPERLASLSEPELRACKMGFRAPYLLACARAVAGGRLNLQSLHTMDVQQARATVMTQPGVGPKIANCVLLFAFGFPTAFPVDVWIHKAIQQLYFPKRAPTRSRMDRFVHSHFGPQAGYAQQYLFHYMRKLG
ncbi:MAG: DNA glycosylase [Verrucomicrobiota bacterium]